MNRFALLATALIFSGCHGTDDPNRGNKPFGATPGATGVNSVEGSIPRPQDRPRDRVHRPDPQQQRPGRRRPDLGAHAPRPPAPAPLRGERRHERHPRLQDRQLAARRPRPLREPDLGRPGEPLGDALPRRRDRPLRSHQHGERQGGSTGVLTSYEVDANTGELRPPTSAGPGTPQVRSIQLAPYAPTLVGVSLEVDRDGNFATSGSRTTASSR